MSNATTPAAFPIVTFEINTPAWEGTHTSYTWQKNKSYEVIVGETAQFYKMETIDLHAKPITRRVKKTNVRFPEVEAPAVVAELDTTAPAAPDFAAAALGVMEDVAKVYRLADTVPAIVAPLAEATSRYQDERTAEAKAAGSAEQNPVDLYRYAGTAAEFRAECEIEPAGPGRVVLNVEPGSVFAVFNGLALPVHHEAKGGVALHLPNPKAPKAEKVVATFREGEVVRVSPAADPDALAALCEGISTYTKRARQARQLNKHTRSDVVAFLRVMLNEIKRLRIAVEPWPFGAKPEAPGLS